MERPPAADPGVTGTASIEDPLLVQVATSGVRGTLIKVGKVGGADVVLRIEAVPNGLMPPEQYLCYLDLQAADGEWLRLHRSTLTPRPGYTVAPVINKVE